MDQATQTFAMDVLGSEDRNLFFRNEDGDAVTLIVGEFRAEDRFEINLGDLVRAAREGTIGRRIS